MSWPCSKERLVDGEEVADRGLGGAGQLTGGAKPLVEDGVVIDVALAQRLVRPVHVQADLVDAGGGHDLGGEVVAGIGDDRDRHAAGTLRSAAYRPVPTLYRCSTPTDWLCPCGKVARALGHDGIGHDQVVVPQRRSRRPEVEALSGQRRVPVLVIDGEVICDSRRIMEYLEFRSPGVMTPRSVTSAVMSSAGVTSKAGLRQGVSGSVTV